MAAQPGVTTVSAMIVEQDSPSRDQTLRRTPLPSTTTLTPPAETDEQPAPVEAGPPGPEVLDGEETFAFTD
jgi:hypothetical protein